MLLRAAPSFCIPVRSSTMTKWTRIRRRDKGTACRTGVYGGVWRGSAVKARGAKGRLEARLWGVGGGLVSRDLRVSVLGFGLRRFGPGLGVFGLTFSGLGSMGLGCNRA
ncbi:hypothetical protein ES332_D04G086100v1 [Gossypium tomentosum]|uniref:Uncharacterized protein n=1 Tax=Gossypium tomentosum TaxID=34277 RepID=A0A5D2LAP8_GOSTO|nr:hypothetical protein ES332_D04G086100v1 [Gossypium tomentosum]